jgi:surface protein
MFWDAKVFNQALNSWDVSGVANMRFMFTGASAFKNHDLSGWNTDNIQSSKRDRFMTDTGSGNTEPSWKQ